MMCVCLHVYNACVCVCGVLCALHVCILVLKPLRELNQQLRPCNAVMTSTRYNILNDVFLISAVVDCGNLTNPANGSVNHTHLNRMPHTVVTQATTWWETVLVCVKLQEIGLGVHLPVKVCCY